MRKNGSLFNNTRMLLSAGLALIFFYLHVLHRISGQLNWYTRRLIML